MFIRVCASESALKFIKACMCVCVYVCFLQRRVTQAGCVGVTRPPRGDAGVHIEDGMGVYVWEVLTASRPQVLSSSSELTPSLNLIVEETVMLPLSLLMFLHVILNFPRPPSHNGLA